MNLHCWHQHTRALLGKYQLGSKNWHRLQLCNYVDLCGCQNYFKSECIIAIASAQKQVHVVSGYIEIFYPLVLSVQYGSTMQVEGREVPDTAMKVLYFQVAFERSSFQIIVRNILPYSNPPSS